MHAGNTTWTTLTGSNRLFRAMRWFSSVRRRWGVRSPRQLQICESLALGERRLLAVVQFEQRRFLIGATANSVVMLAQLSGEGDGDTKAQPEERE